MDVGVLLVDGLCLGADHAEGLAVEDHVVHLAEALLEFLLVEELQVSIAERS